VLKLIINQYNHFISDLGHICSSYNVHTTICGWSTCIRQHHPGRLFVQQPPKKGKGSRGSFKLLRQRLQRGDNYHTARQLNQIQQKQPCNLYKKYM